MADSEIPHAYAYLTQPEVRFLDAAADRLIPPDDLGPGGREARVSVYIDRQLSGVWGVHGRNYRSGPWLEGTPQQGYQSRFTPQEIYRAGIREIVLPTTNVADLDDLPESTREAIVVHPVESLGEVLEHGLRGGVSRLAAAEF